MPTKERTFKCTTGASNKFWKIQKITSNTMMGYRVTWGRVGNKGQSKDRFFHKTISRNNAYSNIILSKLQKGYVETTVAITKKKTEAVTTAAKASKTKTIMPKVGNEPSGDCLMDRLDNLDL